MNGSLILTNRKQEAADNEHCASSAQRCFDLHYSYITVVELVLRLYCTSYTRALRSCCACSLLYGTLSICSEAVVGLRFLWTTGCTWLFRRVTFFSLLLIFPACLDIIDTLLYCTCIQYYSNMYSIYNVLLTIRLQYS